MVMKTTDKRKLQPVVASPYFLEKEKEIFNDALVQNNENNEA